MFTKNKPKGRKNVNSNKKPALTHFLCVPLVTAASRPQLEESLAYFKKDVCAAAIEGAMTEDNAAADSIDNSSPATKDQFEERDESERSTETSTPPTQAPMIAEKAVRPVASLHLTLGVMSLDAEKLKKAVELLENLDFEHLLHTASSTSGSQDRSTSTVADDQTILTFPSFSDEPLNISLTSLHPMQAPQKTSILYISPEDSTNRLNALCSALRTEFSKAELLVPDTRPLKLHATVVNTIYVKGRKRKSKSIPKGDVKADDKGVDEQEATQGTVNAQKAQENESNAAADETRPDTGSQEKLQTEGQVKPETGKDTELKANDTNSGHGPDAKAQLRFDAREIIKRYENHVWAKDFPIDHIAICEMGAKKILDTEGKVVKEEYKEVAVKRLPNC